MKKKTIRALSRKKDGITNKSTSFISKETPLINKSCRSTLKENATHND